MRTWLSILLGFLAGVGVTAALFTFSAQPRGKPVELLPAPTTSPILVDVSGAVVNPGVYFLPPGSRVKDAVEAAGGLLDTADPARLNLALRLEDGEKVPVPALGDPSPPVQAALEYPAGGDSSTETLINVNLASLDELMALPGIGETRARQVIEYREAHGRFATIDEIQNITGIGPETFEKLKDRITVE